VSSERNIAVVLASIEAFNAGDVDAQMATYAPDAVVASDPASDAALVFPDRSVGREVVRSEVTDIQKALGMRYRASEVRPVRENQVLCRGELGGTGVASGVEVYQSVSTLFTLRDGLITRLEFYGDHEEALKAAGLEK